MSFASTKANPSRGGDAKPRGPRGRPGCRKGCFAGAKLDPGAARRAGGRVRAPGHGCLRAPARGQPAHRDRRRRRLRRLLPHRRPQPGRRPPAVGERQGARAEGRQPRRQGAHVPQPVGDVARRPLGPHRHGRDHAGRREPSRVVPAQHQRRPLHLQGLHLRVGRRHRPPQLPGTLAGQRLGEARGGRLGRRPGRRHQPDDHVPLRRRGGREVPLRRRLQRRHRLS
jgi:hypothetical protein